MWGSLTTYTVMVLADAALTDFGTTLELVKAAFLLSPSAHSRGYVLRAGLDSCVEPERRQRQHLVRRRCGEVAGASVFFSRLVQVMIPPAWLQPTFLAKCFVTNL
jgi:hypothetical protein